MYSRYSISRAEFFFRGSSCKYFFYFIGPFSTGTCLSSSPQQPVFVSIVGFSVGFVLREGLTEWSFEVAFQNLLF